MQINEHKIYDSVKLYVCPTNKFKTGFLSMSLVFPVDRVLSPESTLLLSLLKRGTEKYNSLAELNRFLDELYATSFSYKNHRIGDSQVLGFTAEILNDEYIPDGTDILGGVLDIMIQMLYHPLRECDGMLRRDLLESEKINFCDAIRAQKNNTRFYALKRLFEIMCADEPSGISLSGEVETIMALSSEELTARLYALLSTANISFFYVGGDDELRVRDKIASALLREQTKFAESSFDNLIIREAKSLREVAEDMPVSQSKLCMGLRSGVTLADDGYFATLLANEIFGCMQTSKLFMNVREKLGLAYYCSSSLNSYKGIITVQSGIARENYGRTKDEILRQLSLLKAGEISAGELDAAKKSVISSYTLIPDSPSSIEHFHLGRIISGIKNRGLEESIEAVRKTDMSEVIAAAQRITPDTVYLLRGTADAESGEEADDE